MPQTRLSAAPCRKPRRPSASRPRPAQHDMRALGQHPTPGISQWRTQRHGGGHRGAVRPSRCRRRVPRPRGGRRNHVATAYCPPRAENREDPEDQGRNCGKPRGLGQRALTPEGRGKGGDQQDRGDMQELVRRHRPPARRAALKVLVRSMARCRAGKLPGTTAKEVHVTTGHGQQDHADMGRPAPCGAGACWSPSQRVLQQVIGDHQLSQKQARRRWK